MHAWILPDLFQNRILSNIIRQPKGKKFVPRGKGVGPALDKPNAHELQSGGFSAAKE
jgi:hypothetical protein